MPSITLQPADETLLAFSVGGGSVTNVADPLFPTRNAVALVLTITYSLETESACQARIEYTINNGSSWATVPGLSIGSNSLQSGTNQAISLGAVANLADFQIRGFASSSISNSALAEVTGWEIKFQVSVGVIEG